MSFIWGFSVGMVGSSTLAQPSMLRSKGLGLFLDLDVVLRGGEVLWYGKCFEVQIEGN